jgi:TRAP-type transport system periplasmic protein
VAEGPIGVDLAAKVEGAFNCHLLGWGTDGARNMFNSSRPIHVPNDVAGLKMRVQASPVHVKVYESLQALPTPVSFAELYSALQTRVVDGADVSVVDMLSAKLYQVTKYLSMTRHQVIVATTLISKLSMEKLSPEDQAIVREAGGMGMKAQAQATIEKEKTSVGELKANGIEVVEDLPQREEFSKLMGPVYELGVQRFGAELLDRVKAVA